MIKPLDLDALSHRVALASGFFRTNPVVAHKVPPYATDHTVISDVLQKLTREQRQLYCGHLYTVVVGWGEFHSNDDQFALYEPEPWAKCEAYLLTVS